MRRLVLLLALGACDPALEPTPDASSDESPCCELDDEGARACMLEQPDRPPAGTCGVLLCAGDPIRRVNFCVPQ